MGCHRLFLMVAFLVQLNLSLCIRLDQSITAQGEAKVLQYSTETGTDDEPDLTNRPIICILTQPGDLAGPGESYLSAGYVKWLESAGARVAPVLYDMSENEIKEMFHMCNGVVFPGGNYPLKTTTTWFKTAEMLYDLAIEANNQGTVFPVLGTCLGLQLLVTLISRDQYALEPVNAHNHPTHVTWTDEAQHSRMLAHVPTWVTNNLQQLPIAMHNHYYGLVDASLERYPALGKTFTVLARTLDRDNKTYISMIEAKDYPVMGLAFHLEKIPYEWTEGLALPHTREATDAAYHMAAGFVALARKNAHKGRSAGREDGALIYNWRPHYMGKRSDHGDDRELPFEQVYIFDIDKRPTASTA